MLLRTLRFKFKQSERTHSIHLQGTKPHHDQQTQNHAVLLTNHIKQSGLIEKMLQVIFESSQENPRTSNSEFLKDFDFIECRFSDASSSWHILRTEKHYDIRRKINDVTRKSSSRGLELALKNHLKDNSVDTDTANVFPPVKVYHSFDQAKEEIKTISDSTHTHFFHLIATDSQKEFYELQKKGFSWMERASV